jgi:predicted amidohydrolase
MCTLGTEPVTFRADGLTFGCAICVEVNFPEVYRTVLAGGGRCCLGFCQAPGERRADFACSSSSRRSLT